MEEKKKHLCELQADNIHYDHFLSTLKDSIRVNKNRSITYE